MKEHNRIYTLSKTLDEDQVWTEFADPLLGELPPNVLGICRYGFTEMVNNVVDHSDATVLRLSIELSEDNVRMFVSDDGVGIFAKIRKALNLDSEHAAALELAKGGFTTDPDRHTGEGVFFSARMFDSFGLLSGSIAFHFKADATNWIIEGTQSAMLGTFVEMSISKSADRTTKEVFDRFAGEPDYQVDTTVLAIRLLGEGSGSLVSRSQAKRLLSRLDTFKVVVLDFEGVEDIGPAFADELFRVFRRANPNTQIVPVNANEKVNQMILRAVLRNGESGG